MSPLSPVKISLWKDRWICWNISLKEECSLQFDFLKGHFDRFFIAFSEGYFWFSSSQTEALWVYFPMPLELCNLDAYSWSYAHIFGRRSKLFCCCSLFWMIPMQSHSLDHLAPEELTYGSQGLVSWGWCLCVVSWLAKGVYKGGFSYLYHPFALCFCFVCIRPTSISSLWPQHWGQCWF